MDIPEHLQEIVAQFVAIVEGLSAASRQWPEHDVLYVAEHATRRAMVEAARLVLQKYVDSKHGGHRGQHWVDDAGRSWVFKQYVTREIETVVGGITVRAAQYYNAQATPRTTVPHYRDLGLPPGRYSRGMEEFVALAGAEDVYREGLTLINRLTGADVSVHKAATTVGAWGTEAKQRLKADLERPESPAERIAATRPIKGLRRCIAVDGVSVQTTERWREAKLAVGYAFDAKGRKTDPALYTGSLHYAQDFGDLVWRVMETTQASRAEHLVWLGDGAPWIWKLQETMAPHAVAIVDFYHARKRLKALGSVLHPRATAAKRWSKKWTKNLYLGKVTALVAALARLCKKHGEPPKDCKDDDPRKLLADAHRYFRRNAERMDYKTYRSRGYPIGSGVVESSCRHIVGLRMKRTATMTWTERNAEAMIHLRCVRASGEWDRFWGFDKLWRHIREGAA
jgi:hypothetical protein